MCQNRLIAVTLGSLTLLAATVLAEPRPNGQVGGSEAKASSYLRLARDFGRSPKALEAAIVRFAPQDRAKAGPTVDLISAVHVAEKGYYETLNREFAKYDAVLYELVAPEGTRVPKGGGSSDSIVSRIQGLMKDVLNLQFQLNEIDYTRANMVHADMSPEQFRASMQQRGESVFTMFMQMLGHALAQQNQRAGSSTDLQLVMALFDKNRSLALKRVMAEEFENMEGVLTALEGPQGSTLISERNKVALQVLRKQIDEGKTKLAIFYGAGHMSDFQRRLQESFGLKPVSTRWLVAWDLKDPAKATGAKAKDAAPPREPAAVR